MAAKRPTNTPAQIEDIDLGALARAVWSRKRLIWGPTLASVAAMLVFVTFYPPRYTGEAKILLDNQESYLTRPDRAASDAGGLVDPEAVQSQIQLLTSRDLAREAGRKLGLPGNGEFDPVAAGFDPFSRVLILLGMQRDPFKMTPDERVLDKYFDRLTVFQVPRTRVLQVEFTSKDPDLAARGANAVAELFINMRSGAKKDDARQAGSWLAGNIEDLRCKVAEAEAHVESFRAQAGLLGSSNNQTVSSQQLAELNTQLSAARSAQADAQSKAKVIRELIRQGRVFDAPDIARDDLVRRISEQRVTLKAQLALESRTLLPGHPRVKELQAQIADIENELRAAADKAARALDNEARLAGGRVESLAATLEAQKKTVATGNGDEVQLRALEREAKSAREQLESYLAKYREATARDTGAGSPADARVISRAVAPQLPSFPKRVPLLLIAFLASAILSLSIVTAQELLRGSGLVGPSGAKPSRSEDAGDGDAGDEAAEAPADPARSDHAAALAMNASAQQPANDGLPALAVASLGEALARVERLYQDMPGCVVLVTAPITPSCGAALRLARQLARRRRVILLDLDGHEAPLSVLLGKDGAQRGIADLVADQASFVDVIQRDPASRLHVLHAGAGAIEAEQATSAIDALSASYDCVLLAAPSLSNSATSFLMAPHADLVVLCVDSAEATSKAAHAAISELEEAGARDIAAMKSVENGLVQRRAA